MTLYHYKMFVFIFGSISPLEFYLLFLISCDGIQMSPGHMGIIGIVLLGFYVFKNDLSLILHVFIPPF